MDDVIIIGGSFAGLAGALQLGRARRKVTILDTGLPRNRFAGHSHGLLGHDHKPPLDILAEARQQLARYPTIKLVSARAESVSGAIDDFNVLTSDGESFGARRLILSYGVADQMPDVPGFAEGWGTSIVPCPYCDGFEVAGQHWGLVWSGRQSHNYVRLYHDWTDTLTLFADGHDIPPDIRADLARRNIPVVDGRITGIAHHGGHNATVKLDTGPNVAVDILFAHPRNKPSAWNLRRFMRPARRHIALDMRLGSNRIEYQPLGVVGIISPWNYPVNLSLMPVVTAIAAGNRVMLKPSKLTPATNAVLASMFSELFPEEQVATVIGDGSA